MNVNPHIRLFSHYPLLQLAVAFASGVFVATTLNVSLLSSVLPGVGFSFLVVFCWVKHSSTAAGLALLAAIFFAGATLSVIEKRESHPASLRRLLEEDVSIRKRSSIITGDLFGPPEFARDRLYLVIRVDTLTIDGTERKVHGLVSLLATFRPEASEVHYRQLNLYYGVRLRVRTTLNRSEQYRNPGVATLNEYLDRKGYDATGLVRTVSSIERVGDTAVFKPLALLYRWREHLQQSIDRSFSTETAGVLDAALLGNRYNLSKNVSERLREGGTFHVLVISGLHITFIGGVVFFVLKRMTRRRSIQFVASNLVVWSYALAVGAEASVIRAALMFSFVTFGSVMYRSAQPLNALGAAALVLLTASPKAIFDPSFQLTFLSVFAIVAVAWPLIVTFKAIGTWQPTRSTPYPPSCSRGIKSICEILYWSERQWSDEQLRLSHRYKLFKINLPAWFADTYLQTIIRYVVQAILVSLAVQVVLLPFLIVNFHRLSLASLLLNIVVSLLLASLAAVALAALMLGQISLSASAPLVELANGLNWLLVHSVDPFSVIGISSLRVAQYSGRAIWVYGIYYIPLVLLIVKLHRWYPLSRPLAKQVSNTKVWIGSSLQLVLVGVVLLHPLSGERSKGKLRIDFLDVGQGDAALVTFPNDSTLLIDGGGRPLFQKENQTFTRDSRSIGEMVVSEFLWGRGLERVDYVMASHADADHLDGLNDVVNNFSVRAALVGRTPINEPGYSEFVANLTRNNVHLEIIEAGEVLRFGEVTVTVLWPTTNPGTKPASTNNDSVVLLVRFGDRSILMTGDIEKETEARLVSLFQNSRVDVVKVPHHGSRSSSTQSFVATTQPRFAVISVGQNSMFGHPHQEVLDRWRQTGAEVLTTGNCGTITVTTDGKELSVKKYVN